MEGFQHREGFYGGRRALLTIPVKDKWEWLPSERDRRSLVQDAETGEVLSRGFPKFHNFGEVPEEDVETEQAFAQGRVVLREKLDGSLIIRDVVDGEVCWRTRGSLGLGDFEERVMALVNAGQDWWRYDDASYPKSSLLFEYTGPQNRIVVPYPTESLTLLGRVAYDAYDVGGGYWRGITLFDEGVRQFNTADLATVRQQVLGGTMGEEGVVVACYLGYDVKLVKMKSAEYIRLHSLLTECTRAKVFDLLERSQAANLAECRQAIEAAGFDWETHQVSRLWIDEYLDRRNKVDKILVQIKRLIDNHRKEDIKTVAFAMKELCDSLMPGAFALGMAMARNTSWEDHAAAMRCDCSVGVYRAKK